MVRILALIAVGTLVTIACAGSSATPRPSPMVPSTAAATPVSPPPEATPAPPSPSGLYRLDTFAPVTAATLGRRITAAESGTVLVDRANARLSTCDPDIPNDSLRLSLVMTEIRTWSYAPTYEWWFTPDTSGRPTPADPAKLRVSARKVGGKWSVYVDVGAGWTPLADAGVRFGEYEVIVDIPQATTDVLPEPAPTSPPTVPGAKVTNYWWRAIVRSPYLSGDGYDVGGAYPAGGNWFIVC